MSYLLQVLIALDQLLNALFGGWSDETLSSRAYRLRRDSYSKIPEVVINFIFMSNTHCINAYYSEAYRSQQPPEFRINITN